jgi:NAD(P)-dependent dehydrogenase (short-subunit alcohol dehydrogenase family)
VSAVVDPTGSKGAALVIGVGPGLGTALCRRLSREGFVVAGLGRSLDAQGSLAQALARDAPGFRAYAADATRADAMAAVVDNVERSSGPLEVLVYNAAAFHMGPFEELTPEAFEAVWRTVCLGAMTAAKASLPRMAARGRGAAVFTGATASLRGGASFAAFASAKFALRGLVQSLSRAYWPKGVHVAHTILDGIIGDGPDQLHPDDIASAYAGLIAQARSAWTQELDLRPQTERF